MRLSYRTMVPSAEASTGGAADYCLQGRSASIMNECIYDERVYNCGATYGMGTLVGAFNL